MKGLKKYAAACLCAAVIGVSAAPAYAAPTPAPSATPKPSIDEMVREIQSERVIDGIPVSGEFINYRILALYISQLYIDDSISQNDAMLMGLSKYLEEHEGALDEMLKSMFSSLDPYSEFMTGEEFVEFQNAVEQTFYGIGLTFRQSGEYVEITGFVEEDGLAEESGFQIGDKIVKVNGIDVVGWPLDDIRNRILGEVNTTVSITVLRGDEYVDLVGIRTEVRQDTVSCAMLENNIGYIRILSFGSNTADEFREALNSLSDRGVKKIILDLRDNGGGRMDAAVSVAGMIVPKGKIVDVKYRQPEYDVTYNSYLPSADKRFIVLVNGMTASASEILASAIQDSGVGKLYGTQTYGKAVVQQTYPLGSGASYGSYVFKLTVAQYITRNGNEINGVGLTPDVEIENTREPIDALEYTPFDFRTKWSIGDSGKGIRAAKERLYLLGYYAGSSDNEDFFQDLQSAVKTFQMDMGLIPYGIIDIPTQVLMENRFEQLEKLTDNQLEEAYKAFGGRVEDLYETEEVTSAEE